MDKNNISELLGDLKKGKMVIILDDEDRENEGDLVCAAEAVTPEIINFMAKYGRGLICLTLDSEKCEKLQLKPIVIHNLADNSCGCEACQRGKIACSLSMSCSCKNPTIHCF